MADVWPKAAALVSWSNQNGGIEVEMAAVRAEVVAMLSPGRSKW